MSSPPFQPEQSPNPITGTQRPGNGTYDENDFKTRLSDEYKILQDKIDKIGAFRFTVKGWSITAVIAAAAAANGKSLATVCIVSLGLVLMLAFFFLLEYEQVKWSRLFGKRAGRLEDIFRRISRGKGAEAYAAFPVPYTAHELVLEGQRKKFRPRNPESHQPKQTSIWWSDKWHLCRQAHVVFYLVLIALALTLLLPHYDAIGAYWKELRERAIHVLRTCH